jgi:hypothetical protein
MLPELPLLRDPLEYPPEPPLAFAKDIAGAPMRENTIMVAMSVVIFTINSFRRSDTNVRRHHLNSNASTEVRLPSSLGLLRHVVECQQSQQCVMTVGGTIRGKLDALKGNNPTLATQLRNILAGRIADLEENAPRAMQFSTVEVMPIERNWVAG